MATKITIRVDNNVTRTVRIGDNPPVTLVGPGAEQQFDAPTDGAFVVEIGAEQPADPKDQHN